MRNKMRKSVVSAIAGVALGCALVGGYTLGATAYSGSTETLSTNTVTFDTSYRTRITKELSAADEYLGGSIEFDLLNTNLKDSAHIDGDLGVGKFAFDSSSGSAYSLRSIGFASINFNFFKLTDTMSSYAWRVGEDATTSTSGAIENQAGSFSYFADGRVVEYSGSYDSGTRYQVVHAPGSATFVGTEDDANAFMNEGYSYKVSWVWGTVSADKTVKYAQNGAHNEAWYVAYSKPIDVVDADYSVLFAFKVTNPQKVTSNSGKYAGFEISAHSAKGRQATTAGKYSENAKNVTMEMDNIAIYDGYYYASATAKAKTDFEGTYTDLALSTGTPVSGGRVANELTYGGNPSSAYFDNHITTVDGLKVQTTNGAIELIEKIATRTVNTRTKYVVEYVDQSTDTLVARREVFANGNPTAPTLAETGDKVYEWIDDPASVTANTVVYGSLSDESITKTNTVSFDTSYRTRATKKLSNATEYLGGSIEFDLLSSNMKDQYNIDGDTLGLGLNKMTFDNSTAYMVGRIGFASINFNFFKRSDVMSDYAWRIGDYTTSDGVEEQAASFSYFADGRVVEYSGAANYGGGTATGRMQKTHSVGDATFVGSQEDVNAFMTAGYSYKVSWVWGSVSADKSITFAQNGEHDEAWYVVYSKAFDELSDAYKVLFAFKVTNPQKVNTASGAYAGFEISANNLRGRTYTNDAFSDFARNVSMEMDNIAIYDGYDYETATAKAKTDFEGDYSDLALSTGAPVGAGRGNTDYGVYGANASSTFFDNHITIVDGIKIQSTNAAIEMIDAIAQRTILSKRTYNITYTDGENVLATSYVIEGNKLNLPQTINGFKYTWNTEGIDVENVTKTLTIVGSKTVVDLGDDLKALNVGLGGDITMRAYFTLPETVVEDVNAFILVSVGGEETARLSVATLIKDTQDRYVVEVPLAAAQMTQKVDLTVVSDGVCGTTYSYSVLDYATAMLERNTTTDEQKAMIKAMLNYGAYAQVYFDVDADNLANEDIFDGANPIDSVTEIIAETEKGQTTATGIASMSYEIYLTSTTSMKIFVILENGADISNYQFALDNEEVQVEEVAENKYCIVIENIAAAYLDAQYYIRIINTNDNTVSKVTVSAMSCAATAFKATENVALKNLMKAFYLYNQAANEFFNV